MFLFWENVRLLSHNTSAVFTGTPVTKSSNPVFSTSPPLVKYWLAPDPGGKATVNNWLSVLVLYAVRLNPSLSFKRLRSSPTSYELVSSGRKSGLGSVLLKD